MNRILIITITLCIISITSLVYSQEKPADILNRANQHRNSGNDIEAINNYSEYINLIKDNYNAYYLRGLTYYKLKMFKAAEADLLQVIELNDTLAVVYNILGLISQEQTENQTAMQYYSKALEYNYRYAEVYNNRGFLYGKIKNYNLALVDLNNAINFDKNKPGYYYNRGYILVEMDKYQDALKDFTMAIQLNPNYSLAYMSRGICHYQLGNYSDCIYDLQLAKQLDPSHSTEADKFIRAAKGFAE